MAIFKDLLGRIWRSRAGAASPELVHDPLVQVLQQAMASPGQPLFLSPGLELHAAPEATLQPPAIGSPMVFTSTMSWPITSTGHAPNHLNGSPFPVQATPPPPVIPHPPASTRPEKMPAWMEQAGRPGRRVEA